MSEVFGSKNNDVEFWKRQMAGQGSAHELKAFLEGNGYRATLDYPTSLYYK